MSNIKMDKKELLKCIDFFNRLTIKEEDVTTDQQRANGQLVVKATYEYEGESFTTKPLHYINIANSTGITRKKETLEYFGKPVYWLDVNIHGWPKDGDESDLENIVINDITDPINTEFQNLLRSLANNKQKGFIQRITRDGRPGRYYHNLENNNHWHDLTRLIKAAIENKGKPLDKDYFSRLVFRWDGRQSSDKRTRCTLTKHAYPAGRRLIDSLYQNIKSVQMELKTKEIAELLMLKYQLILQGPPGTGKTYTAKDIAEHIIFGEVSPTKEEQKERLEYDKNKRYKLIQFHPAYTYEDFVRGITIKPHGTSIAYEAANRVLGDFAERAAANENENFVLIIDEINRANLPAVLGELIYALEYRGDTVESMYAINGVNKLVLPKNLFIIGTMNTADRSVGHIDYAIRRRFAFKDMLPQRAVIEDHYKDNSDLKNKATGLFDAVAALFSNGSLASDFKPKDVQLGHSYFMADSEHSLDLKLKYEIKPLLLEFVKDGVLLEKTTLTTSDTSGKNSTEAYINNLSLN